LPNRITVRERAKAVAAERAATERYLRDRLAKYPPGSAGAEAIAEELACRLRSRPAMQRYADLFGMPPLMMLGGDLAKLDPAVREGHRARPRGEPARNVQGAGDEAATARRGYLTRARSL
jgi:hypothetical protein